MVEFCYPDGSTAAIVARLLADMYPIGPRPRVDDRRVAVPWSMWQLPLVPELALGYGGRMVDGSAIASDEVA